MPRQDQPERAPHPHGQQYPPPPQRPAQHGAGQHGQEPYRHPQEQRPGAYGPPPGQYGYAQQHPQQYVQQAPPPPPKRKRKVWPWVLLAVVVMFFGGCALIIGGAATAVNSASGPVTVRYELGGSGTAAAVTYSSGGAGNGISQEGTANLPWSKEVTIDNGLAAFPTLGASNGDDGGQLTCKITNTATGKVIAEGQATGPYSAVSCAGAANTP